MGTQYRYPHALTPAELAAERHRNVTGFLSQRGLSATWLSAFLQEQVGRGVLLLTSSPVHGLANATSDLDFIRIQDEEIKGPRIATKIFEQGHHLEVVSFSRAEVRSNLDELARLAAAAPGATVAGFRAWDRAREPRRKQTERIVNGVGLDGSGPFADALPDLGTVWSRASVDTAVAQAAHTVLAERAGEWRGRVGYAYNALLFLMDAVLSHHGDVYTTRKWYLLRWARIVASGEWIDDRARALAGELERLRRSVSEALAKAELRRPLSPDYVDLAVAAARLTGIADAVSVRIEAVDDTAACTFLPGASMVMAAGRGVLLPDDGSVPLLGRSAGLAELADLDSGQAAALLRALRAGMVRLRAEYQRTGE